MNHILLLIVLITGCGLLGGIINYFRTSTGFVNSGYILAKSLVTGLGASALVPLFLKMISSDLLSTSAENNIEYFVISGFCLISSIFSAKFIESIGEKLQLQVNKVENEVKEVKKELQEVTTENEYGENAESSTEYERLDEDEKDILQKMYLSKYTYRSVSGIASEIYSTREETIKFLADLEAKNYVVKLERENSAFRWKLSDKGRKVIAENYGDESSS